ELGGTAVEIDFAPFLEAAHLLYEGPWVAERYAAIEDFIEQSADSLHPVTRQIIAGGATPRAAEAFKAQYRLAALRRTTEAVWDEVDLIVTPTAGRHYRIDEVEADPVQKNSDLGYYTNFMNLLDFAALAVPTSFRGDGLPFGVTLFAPAFTDRDLLALGDRLQRASVDRLGATGQPLPSESLEAGGEHVIPVAVCGAHLSGLPLNWQLTERRARLAETTTTAPEYRLYALPGGPPERPGLVRVSQGGAAIDVEVWHVPASEFGSFVAGIPGPLGIGKLRLVDGRELPGFIAEPIAMDGAIDITHLGGWRHHINSAG
ncbi:MAG TPA: allophanate hydrolase, partial [Chromatiales bacterium]|nr:allophanate hydrolase [Chromatiales bacterium]